MSGELFEFPQDMTRRERWLFEKNAGGITLAQFGKLLSETPEKLTTQMEAALVLVAVRRVRPSVTIDQVLDSDWSLAAPVSDAAEVADPLAPPTPPSVDTKN